MSIKKLRSKINIILGVLSGKYKHCFLVNLKTKQLENLLVDKDFEIEIDYYGVQPYIINKVAKEMSENTRDTDLMLQKLEFEVKAKEYSKT